MKTVTRLWSRGDGWDQPPSSHRSPDFAADLILVFWDSTIDPAQALASIHTESPDALIVGCSTPEHIVDGMVSDSELVATEISFGHATVRGLHSRLTQSPEQDLGHELAKQLLTDRSEPPKAVLILADGIAGNASELLAALQGHLRESLFFGGLAGRDHLDGSTQIAFGDQLLTSAVIAVGIWGEDIEIAHGTAHSWEPFGPVRTITKSTGSTLSELDGMPALAIYQNYLGETIENLPGAALHFPLRLISPDGKSQFIRSVLSIDSDTQSLLFAGDVPQGWHAEFMRTTIDRIVEGAARAAESSVIPAQRDGSSLVIAVSSVGRKVVLGERIDEEAEICAEVLGEQATLRGFYSLGEFSPLDGRAHLHNQTITLTALFEPHADDEVAP